MPRVPILTQLLKDRSSGLAQHLAATFPNTMPTRRAIQASSGAINVESGLASLAGTTGTAFDAVVRMVLDSAHEPLHPAPSFTWTPAHDAWSRTLTTDLQYALPDRRSDSTFYRRAWLLALLAEGVRAPGTVAFAPITPLVVHPRTTIADLDELVPDEGIDQVAALDRLADQRLYPHLTGPFSLSPSFRTRILVQAEADLIAGDALVDIKTGAGRKRTTGRFNLPDATDIFQIVSYALLDHDDEYGIRRVGFYAARYGSLQLFDLQQFLDTLAGHPVDITVERRRILDALD